ncbi:MAG TPA: hypothetical protein VGW39_11715 [Chthoniobacterales bacterium]|nr:hypothetical protein [Chthoniobacterales bacterium]
MDHRLLAVLVVVCFAFWGAGCASESQREDREEILMPRQTGSILQRRVMVKKTDSSTKKSKEKKEKKESKEKKEKKEKKETKSATPKPAPEPEATEEPTEEATPAPPDRFR